MIKVNHKVTVLLFLFSGWACQPKTSFKDGSFGKDEAFLRKYDSSLVRLQSPGGKSALLVSPQFQGKVFTSTTNGDEGYSYGWINYDLIASGKETEHMNAYGSEDRFWIGPEGGQFSVYFKKGTEMKFENWFVPGVLDTESFNLISATDNTVVMQKEMSLENYSGTTFSFTVDRKISLLSQEQVRQALKIEIPEGIHWVGYESENSMTNTGDSAWTQENGALAIWILGMFRPSAEATIVVPYQSGDTTTLGPIATTDYFGPVGSDRVFTKDGILYFKVDGKKRSKIGLSHDRARNFAGSYDEANHALTVITFPLPEENVPYVNQLWEMQKEPFKGDALNVYNDGPLDDGSQLGPFYELESVSPAAFLKPGEKIIHHHTTFHFEGEEEKLDLLTKQIFGISLEEIRKAF